MSGTRAYRDGRKWIHQILGQHALALATFRKTDELLLAEKEKGWGENEGHADMLVEIGVLYLMLHQLEAAKSCFQRVLAKPGLTACDRMNALQGMARYHKERQDWVQVIELGKAALALVPRVKRWRPIGRWRSSCSYCSRRPPKSRET